ncbi:MAG: hypothetical protein ACK5OX_13545 [Desertimonas sp.]
MRTWTFGSDAYVGLDAIAAPLADDPDWAIERPETRPRPPGAASSYRVDDVILRARRTTS